MHFYYISVSVSSLVSEVSFSQIAVIPFTEKSLGPFKYANLLLLKEQKVSCMYFIALSIQ